MSNPNVKDAILFIQKHRKGNAFKDYTEEQIATLLCTSTTLAACDKENNLVGIICAVEYPEQKELFIHDILTTEKWVIKEFMFVFAEKYKGWNLVAMRRNKYTEYNTVKLMNKIFNKEIV